MRIRDITVELPGGVKQFKYEYAGGKEVVVGTTKLMLTLYSTTIGARPSYRAEVCDAEGNTLYDSDDCYDAGNATHNTNNWLAEYMKKHPPAETCDVCKEVVTEDTVGQRTADCLMCVNCVNKTMEKMKASRKKVKGGEAQTE